MEYSSEQQAGNGYICLQQASHIIWHLMCVSYVVVPAHFSNSSSVMVPENKEPLIRRFYHTGTFKLWSSYRKIDNCQLFRKNPFWTSVHLFHYLPKNIARLLAERLRNEKNTNTDTDVFLPGVHLGCL